MCIGYRFHRIFAATGVSSPRCFEPITIIKHLKIYRLQRCRHPRRDDRSVVPIRRVQRDISTFMTRKRPA